MSSLKRLTAGGCTTGDHISNVPVDILSLILGLLPPTDIMRARKCCRLLYDLSQERVPWIQSLRSICEATGTFAPTFPFDRMSLRDLESAALAPTRFESLLRKNRVVTPAVSKILNSPFEQPAAGPAVTMPEQAPFLAMSTVPGGRFIITATERLLSIYDIGRGAESIIKCEPLATFKCAVGMTFGWGRGVDASSLGDGLGLRVVAHSRNEDDAEHVFDILETYPASESPSFSLTASLTLQNESVRFYSIQDTRLAVICSAHTVLWDFLRNEWILVPFTVAPESVCDMFLWGQTLVILDNEHFSVLEMPPLRPRAQGVDFVVTDTPVVAHIPYPRAFIGYGRRHPWFYSVRAKPGPIFFDIAHGPQGDVRVARYVLRAIENHASVGLPGCLPVLLEQHNLSPIDVLSDPSLMNSWNGATEGIGFLVWAPQDFKHITLHLSQTTCSTPVEPRIVPSTTMISATQSYGILYELCPMSGRIFVIDTNGTIQVNEYILPCPS